MKKSFASILLMLLVATAAVAQSPDAATYENGKPKYAGEVANGQKVGEWKYFYDNGEVSRQGVFQAGEPTGVWKEYFKGGQVKSEGKYTIIKGNGVKTGLWTTYHKNGAKEFEGRYEAGKPVGTWIEYNTLGIQLKKIEH